MQVLIQIGPVDSVAVAEKLDVGPFYRCGEGKARIPFQWHGERATVGEMHRQALIVCLNADSPWFLFKH